jgi:outer membrane lipoprotein-sorting protein
MLLLFIQNPHKEERSMKRFIGVLVILTSLMFVACAKKATVDDVVNKMVQAQGGAQALAAFQDQVSTWDSKAMVPQGDTMMTMSSEMIITYKRPNKIKFEGKMPDGTLAWASVFDGTNGWQYMMGQMRDMTPTEIQETLGMAETWLDGWHDYAVKGITLTMLADTTMNGKTYHVIQATDKHGNVSKNYCDTQTGMVERMEAEMSDPASGMKKPGAMTFTDYASYGGFMMAKKVVSYDEQGNMVWESTLKDCQQNVGVADDAFVKPMAMEHPSMEHPH